MSSKRRFWRWLFGVTLLVAAESATVVAIDVAMTTPAEAQYRDDRYPFLRRQRQRSGGFFEDLFGDGRGGDSRGGGGQRAPARVYREPPQQQTDHSRAPSPRKADSRDTTESTTSIVVMGDGLADWLAYGLEDAFADSPEVAIVRKDKAHSGLIRYQSRSDLDWWHVARDILSKEKANYVVMILGVTDRQNIRERDVAKDDEKFEQEQQELAAQNQDRAENPDQPATAAPESKPKSDPKPRPSNAIIEFRSDRWAEVYSRRIDETIAALKSKGVPVFWVGLPSIRGTKSTADAVYLNDLFRARAANAGIVYIDIWDGFVDESGKYSNFGPDYEGQIRRLRSSDGVYFTRHGARKLAHYVEREIRRVMNNRALPVALPSGPLEPLLGDGKSVRPLAGPVVPLTVSVGNADALAGGTGINPAQGDTLATQVLIKGQPLPAPAGRADDFAWPPGSSAKKETPTEEPAAGSPAAGAPVRGAAEMPMAIPALETAKPAEITKPAEAARAPAERSGQPAPARARPALPADARPRPPQNVPQRRSQSTLGAEGAIGWVR